METKAAALPAINTEGVDAAEKFRAIGTGDAGKLNAIGIYTTNDLLEAGATKIGSPRNKCENWNS